MKVRSLSRRPPPSKRPAHTTACERFARNTNRGRFRCLRSTKSLHIFTYPAHHAIFIPAFPEWRNWQTQQTQKLIFTYCKQRTYPENTPLNSPDFIGLQRTSKFDYS